MQGTAKPGAGSFNSRQLLRSLGLISHSYQFDRTLDAEEPLLSGSTYYTRALQRGLVLHCVDVQDLHDMTTRSVQLPGMEIDMLVGGATCFAFGSRDYRFGAGDGRATAAVTMLTEQDTFRREWKHGRREQKVSISLSPEWIEQAGLARGSGGEPLARFTREHLASRQWTPSAQAAEAARQILQPPEMAPALREIFLQARSLDIVLEAVAAIAGPGPDTAPRLRPRDRQRLARLRELLDSGQADGLSLDAIARRVGSNPTDLQRLWRGQEGTTIFDYLRQRRLRQACRALRRDMASVEQAAAIAGYASATNFATAFRRMFGVSPSAARNLPAYPPG